MVMRSKRTDKSSQFIRFYEDASGPLLSLYRAQTQYIHKLVPERGGMGAVAEAVSRNVPPKTPLYIVLLFKSELVVVPVAWMHERI